MSSPDAGNSVWNEEEFDAVLNEFNVVIDDLSCSAKTGVQYEEHLNQMKRMGATSAMDSGIDDPETKLGDTKDLEDFIADLDQTLAEMM
ncbi:regulator of cell cycle RGCC-like isoform X2 [Pristis pectinata]|uniref:regulator of cell cycle RGCC-like isoform X2 n=1 Tax=Pristis pectinata TaxID=685728 RepID=UPI00223D8DA2|nr:regulator of cell cycle RGCC-like isoform X2 [Pristis pectinata]